MDLSTTIAGVRFPSCFMNASGALCVTREELLALGRSRAGAIVTKSMTIEPRDGNPAPRYYGFPGGSINSMGLPNLGYKAYAALIPELKTLGKPVIASVAGLCEDDFPTIAATINAAKPDLIEVNLSCPNIPGKPQIGYDAEASERLLKRVRKVITVPMGVKLPPYFDPAHHKMMGEVIGRCGVDFLNLINSVGNGLVVDPEREVVVIKPKGGFGGLGGTYHQAGRAGQRTGFLEDLRRENPDYRDRRRGQRRGCLRTCALWRVGRADRDGLGRRRARCVRPLGNGAGGTAQQEGLFEVGGLPGKAEGAVGLLGPECFGKETQLEGPSE